MEYAGRRGEGARGRELVARRRGGGGGEAAGGGGRGAGALQPYGNACKPVERVTVLNFGGMNLLDFFLFNRKC